MLSTKEPTFCLCCGKPVKGRSDKKFCDDYCRSEYNNSLKADKTNLMRNINNALSKNRRILLQLLGEAAETAKAHQDKMVSLGLQFKYHTHTYTNKKGDVYFFCYDVGYLPIDNGWYLLVKRKEE
jgi:predicted nucleic acid-binding Zn ribbon protein